jgi:hypothetical protein
MKRGNKRILIAVVTIIAVGGAIVVVFGQFVTRTARYKCNVCGQRWKQSETKLWDVTIWRYAGRHLDASHPAPINAGVGWQHWTILGAHGRIGCGGQSYPTGWISMAQSRYAQTNDGRYADDIGVLVELVGRENLFSLDSRRRPPMRDLSPLQVSDLVWKQSPFILIPGLTQANDPKRVVVFARPDEAVDGKIELGFGDHHTSLVPLDEARAMIEKQTGMTVEQLIERQENYTP